MKVSELKITDIKTTTEGKELTFVNIDQEPFKIYGIYRDGECYCRLPEAVAECCCDGVKLQRRATAGGRVRFVTSSPYISVRITLLAAERSRTMTDIITSGADVYVGKEYRGTVKNTTVFNAATGEDIPNVTTGGAGSAVSVPEGVDIAYECLLAIGDTKGQPVTVNFPAYNGVKEVYIGFKNDAEISHAPDYSLDVPIVFYGSSITQGADASRPGTSYQNRLCRELDFNYINLGFSGGAMAEPAISEYISGLDMSAFVYDYDHNAPSVEHLSKTHGSMLSDFRKKQPNTPILILSRPYGRLTEDIKKRQEIIKKTYDDAKSKGDENVYLILGSEYFPSELGGDFSVDNCHPNDIGFMYMAKTIAPVIAEIIKKLN